jgi:hypothetical protein
MSFPKYEGRKVGVGGLALALAWFDHMSGDGIEIDVDAVSSDELEDITTGGLDTTILSSEVIVYSIVYFPKETLSSFIAAADTLESSLAYALKGDEQT